MKMGSVTGFYSATTADGNEAKHPKPASQLLVTSRQPPARQPMALINYETTADEFFLISGPGVLDLLADFLVAT